MKGLGYIWLAENITPKTLMWCGIVIGAIVAICFAVWLIEKVMKRR